VKNVAEELHITEFAKKHIYVERNFRTIYMTSHEV
jgi:hypothetical protein